MFGKNPDVNRLHARKQLLVAESELNRAQLLNDVATISAGLRSVAERAKSYGSIASAAAVLVATLAACKQAKPAAESPKSSWFQSLIKSGGLISTLWLAFRSNGRDQRDTQSDS